MNDALKTIAELSPEKKRARLAQLLQNKANGTNSFPLSFPQQRLWFLDQLDPNNPTYNIPAAFRLKGQLSIPALKESLSEIQRRHKVLQTQFETVDGKSAQIIVPDMALKFSVVDLQNFPENKRETKMQRLFQGEIQLPFELAKGPLWRATLFCLGKQENVLLLIMHHIISDAWSFGIFMREMAAFYQAFLADKPRLSTNGRVLPELPIQYTDFALRQRKWLEGENAKNQLSYWKQQLAGAPTSLDLPTDHPRSVKQTFRGARHSIQLTKELTQSLKKLSLDAGATVFMTVLAAFEVMLHRYTGQSDLCVGTPIANRDQEDIENLIGFFINALVLRVHLDGNPRFRELIAQVREVALGAYDHQDLPFEKLVDELQPERDMGRPPLFQVMFSVLNTPTQSLNLNLPGLTLETLNVHNGRSKFDLSVAMWEESGQLSARFEYNTTMFEAPTISRMGEHFRTILEAIVTNPDQRVSQIPLLTEAERSQILVQWTTQENKYPKEKCLHSLFEEQVDEFPDSVAVTFGETRLTYGELNSGANKLAHYLRRKGVVAGSFVAMYFERSLEMVIGILAILKAGGAYVPLDPSYPKDRLTFMLQDTGSSVLLSQREMIEKLPDLTGVFAKTGNAKKVDLICIDSEWEKISEENDENIANGLTADSFSYVIYTSGSTGKPKGVPITHYNVVRLFQTTEKWFRFNEKDVWTLFHSYAFDFSVWELWGALLNGGKLVVVPHLVSRSPEAFYDLLCEEHVTVLNQTPSAFRQLIHHDTSSEAKKDLHLRVVILGGEALELQSLKPWFDRHGDECPKLVNMYGITETTVHVTYRPLTADDLTSGSVIGRPISDLQIYLLDSHKQPVPIGVPGEIYIGGAGLAGGYLNRDEITRERFVPNPFDDTSGARLYRSGDLGRYLPDGDIEYLGRIDHQVKIRGFRIELGEIESTLAQHSSIDEVVVLAREDDETEKRLVAYIVSKTETIPTVSELRCFLLESLPDYMVPTAFVFLDDFPLTPNGKVDRPALPLPDSSRPELEGTFLEPQTSAQKILADIWSKLLRLDRVGIHDNFFELGGDSILSIQIIARANNAGLRLTPRQIFEHQTIAKLASVAGTVETPKGEQGPVTGPVEFTPVQHWFFEQNLLKPHHFNQSMLLEIRKPLDFNLLKKVLQELVVYHDALRLRFEKKGDSWQQVIVAPDRNVPFTRIDLSTLPKDEQSAAIESHAAELQASLHLSKGPLIRFAFFDFGAEKSGRLLMILHHLASDGVSWRILLSDIRTAYQQLSRGEAIQLPPKTTSFKKWAEQLVDYAQSEKLTAEQDYWVSNLALRSNPLPVDIPAEDGVNLIESARLVKKTLDAEETSALLQAVPKAYHTQINDVLLTALVQAFAQWTGSESLLIDMEGHGREDIFDDVDLSRTIGWFTTIFPVHLDLGKALNPGDALKTIKEQVRSIPNQGIGYGLLRYLNREGALAKQMKKVSQAQVSFNYLGQFDQVLRDSALFDLAQEERGPALSSKETRSYLLEINSRVVEEKLQMAWTYSSNLHNHTTIEKLAQDFMTRLQEIISHCNLLESGGYTPSDFSLTNMNQQELDMLIKKKLKKS